MKTGKMKNLALTGLIMLGALVAAVEAVQFGLGQVNGLGLPYDLKSDPGILPLSRVLDRIERMAPDVADRIDVHALDRLLQSLRDGSPRSPDQPGLGSIKRAIVDPGWTLPNGSVLGGDPANAGSLTDGSSSGGRLSPGSSKGGQVGGSEEPDTPGSRRGQRIGSGDTPDVGSLGGGLSKGEIPQGAVGGPDSPEASNSRTERLGREAAPAGPVSGGDQPDAASKRLFSDGVSVGVLDPSGGRSTQVMAADVGDASYWFEYLSNGISSGKVTIVAVPVFDGSPLRGIKQEYHPESHTNILSPFAIPFWAGNATSGLWVVIAASDQGYSAMSYFEVVP